tara:strand:- start:867 stop:1193 length:327 start_codon:yes stop_codon:yes gene_type:complete
MNLPPRDYTNQENIIALILDEFGMRYEQQFHIPPYILDFYIPDIKMVIEADGVYGHLQKQDIKRDTFLLDTAFVEYILHVPEVTKTKIKERIWQALNKLSEPDQSPHQ